MTETPAATGPSPDFAPAVAAGMALPSKAARRMVRAIGFLGMSMSSSRRYIGGPRTRSGSRVTRR